MTNTAETKSSNSALPKGEISGVNGPVVDVAFQKDSLPRIREALFVVINGKNRVMEVAQQDRKSTRLNSSHSGQSRMPSSA